MVKINLLDWRQAKRERRQKGFLIALGGAAGLGLLFVVAMVAKMNADIEYQKERNNRLTQEIKRLDKQIAEIDKLEKVKRDLLARMRIIEELQQSRTEIVHFFDEIVTATPAGLYLNELSQKGKTTTLKGISESNGRVSTYIRNIDDSEWFTNPQLIVIKTDDKQRRRLGDFAMQFSAKKMKKDEEGEE